MSLKKEEKEKLTNQDLSSLQVELFTMKVRNRAGIKSSSFRSHLIHLTKKKIAYLKQKENLGKK